MNKLTPLWGAGGREFETHRPDQIINTLYADRCRGFFSGTRSGTQDGVLRLERSSPLQAAAHDLLLLVAPFERGSQ